MKAGQLSPTSKMRRVAASALNVITHNNNTIMTTHHPLFLNILPTSPILAQPNIRFPPPRKTRIYIPQIRPAITYAYLIRSPGVSQYDERSGRVDRTGAASAPVFRFSSPERQFY
jgi:hypothetical protein